MIVLKIIAVIWGLAFTLLGYLIFFKKKYSLINGFDAAYKAGQKTEDSAKRIGLVDFVVGLAMFVAAVILIVFD